MAEGAGVAGFKLYQQEGPDEDVKLRNLRPEEH